MKSELNSRQWNLYNTLKERGGEWLRQEELATIVPEYNYKGTGDFKTFHDTTVRKVMTADIRTINDSGVIQKVIITGAKGVKLATKEEFTTFIKREFAAVFRRLERVRKKAKKAGLDKQMKLVFNTERDTIEAFFDDNKK